MDTRDYLEVEHEAYVVSESMKKYGGSFVQALGETIARADVHNKLLIRSTWHSLWMEYLEKKKKAVKHG